MADFGVTPEGFVRKTQRDILDEMEADQKAGLGPLWDVSSDSVAGQMNGAHSRQLAICWEQLEALHNGNDPDVAEERLLENLCKLTGTTRRGATQSQVTLTCNLDAGTELVANDTFAAIDGNEDVRWTPLESYTATVDGDVDLIFVAENTGPIAAAAGTITVMATTVVGWNSVTNAEDADPGRPIDDDVTLGQRREAELATAGSTTVRAIRANLSNATKFPDIESVYVYENETDETDGDGRPPHTVEALIFDGEVPATDNDLIAQEIWDSKAGGVSTYGDETGTAIIDEEGTTKVVRFSRSELVEVYVAFTITTGSGYVGNAALKAYVAEQADARHGSGDDVFQSVIQSLPYALTGVKNVSVCAIGVAPAPTLENDIAIGVRQVARFDTSRITVNGA